MLYMIASVWGILGLLIGVFGVVAAVVEGVTTMTWE